MNLPELKKKYINNIVPLMMKEFDYKNIMQVPKVKKITINMGLGEAVKESKLIESGMYTLSQITGQKPVVSRAKKAISDFKLRAGLPIGCYVNLRGNKMYEFLERLINFTLPNIRDFKGVSNKSFDGKGNYTIGLSEQLIFPEIEYDKIIKTKGMNITIVTTADSDKEGRGLLGHLGVPFRK